MILILDYVLALAHAVGIQNPQITKGGDGEPVVADLDSGERWAIELRPLSRPAIPGLDQSQALAEGWCVADVEGTFLEIQRCENSKDFPTDLAADKHVRWMADEGSAYHLHVLRYITAENRQRYESGVKPTGSIYAVLRSWSKVAITDRSIIRVRADFDPVEGPYQEAVRQAVGSNQDVVDLGR